MTDPNRTAGFDRTVLVLAVLHLPAASGFTLVTDVGRLPVLDPAATLVRGTAAPPTWAGALPPRSRWCCWFLALLWILA
ncbi:hypothetical protein [Amycolatopsis sp. Hca4]|uniref:hypothetical protein n=1 Tax=Amycolatopsis sp. Hca4 TaxID=2742131 RepID=UPI0015901BAE|nr:hypothetical protein [Amycolatopsis sp. Hca4]QKV73649.1 hypothetical protein HUT10_07565 [Amycolatopsis sp. Hca4]